MLRVGFLSSSGKREGALALTWCRAFYVAKRYGRELRWMLWKYCTGVLGMRLRAGALGSFNVLIRKQHKLRLAVAENFAEKTFILGEGLSHSEHNKKPLYSLPPSP